MTASARRRHAHRGSVVAVGLVVEPSVIGEREARRRVLAWWAVGCEVRAVAGQWIVRGGAARRIRVADAPGAPLVAMHGGLVALPVAATEVPAAGAVVVARGGEVVVIGEGEGEAIDPARWLEVDGWAVVAVDGLSAPPAAVTVPAAVVAGRARFGVGEADAEAAAVAAAVAGTGAETEAGTEAESGTETEAGTGKASWWSRAVAKVFGAPRTGTGTGTGTGTEEPGWFERMKARAALEIWKSALGRAIGRRHADYLRETLDLFDRGDLDEALRRAIPIGGSSGGPVRLGVGLPGKREAITPSLERPAGARVIPVGIDAVDELRLRYVAARDRLIREDRIDEAAFVIADLLGDPEAAVALLERHHRFGLAAELAEARELPAALVIRQWFLAGDTARAVAVARRTGAFAAAIERAGHQAIAEALTVMWANALAEAGDYLGALAVSDRLDDDELRERLALDAWIELGIAGGGVAAARLWIRRLVRSPGQFAEVRGATLALLTGGPEVLDERIAIADALTAAPPSPAVATLARAAVRAMLADLGRGVDGEPATLLPRLVRVAGDPALRADLPALGTLRKRDALVDRATPTVRRWARSDAGAIAVHDVASLPGGRVLVALGELGVRLLTADGRTVARWDQPAEALVISDHGTAAIAVATRGAVRRLAHLDLARRTARPWCEAVLDSWAPTFDGALWLVSRGADLLAVDVHRDDLRATWGVTMDGYRWTDIARDGDRWAVGGGDFGPTEVWCYQHFTLRRRSPVSASSPPGRHAAWPGFAALPDSGSFVIAAIELAGDTGPRELLGQALRGPDWRIDLDPRRWRAAGADAPALLAGLTVAGRFAAIDVAVQGWGHVVEVFYLPTQRSIALLGLEGTARLSMRFDDLCLCLGDDRGRVLVCDLRTGALRRDLRLR